MADDIVTRLRHYDVSFLGTIIQADLNWALDEILRLREQVDSLSKQLDQAVSRG